MRTVLIGLYGTLVSLAVTAFLVGPALAYFRVVPAMAGFGIMAGGAALCIPLAIAGLVGVARDGVGVVAIFWLMTIGPIGYLGYSVNENKDFPMIHDISTELNYPPPFVDAATLEANEGQDMAFPAANKTLVKESYPDLQSLAVAGTLDSVYFKIHELAKQQPGWTVQSVQLGATENTIEGYAESGLFRFRDDFSIRITELDQGGCVVDMRSRSRDGEGDMGANAERIRKFYTQIAPPTVPAVD